MAGKLHPGQRPPNWQPPEGTAKPGGFRWWHGVLIALGLLIVIGLFAPPPDPAEQTAEAEALAAASIPSERQLTSGQLANIYDANEVAAQRFADAGPLQVTGTITSIELDFADNPVVQLEGLNDFNHVSVYFGDSQAGAAASLMKGQELTVICADVSEIIGSPQLKDCVLAD